VGVTAIVALGFGFGDVVPVASGVASSEGVGVGVDVSAGCSSVGASPAASGSGAGGDGWAGFVVSATVTGTPSGGASMPVRRMDHTPASGESSSYSA